MGVCRSSGIKTVFRGIRITAVENNGPAVGRCCYFVVGGTVVEYFELQSQRIEYHFDAHQRDQRDRNPSDADDVAAQPFAPLREQVQYGDHAERGGDFPLRLYVSARRGSEEKQNESGRNTIQSSQYRSVAFGFPPSFQKYGE